MRNSFKRVMSIFLALFMMFCMIPCGWFIADVQAAPGETGGYGSNGKFLAPIEAPIAGSIPISNRADLEKIGNDPSYPMSGSYHLTNDIDLSGAEWTPIGTYEKPFYGVLDGRGYIIRNLTITGMDSGIFDESATYANYGLFGISGGHQIRNTAMEDVNIALSINNLNRDYFAVVSPLGCSRDMSTSWGDIRNCYITGRIKVAINLVNQDSFRIGANASGLISSVGRMQDCYSTTDISLDISVRWQ